MISKTKQELIQKHESEMSKASKDSKEKIEEVTKEKDGL